MVRLAFVLSILFSRKWLSSAFTTTNVIPKVSTHASVRTTGLSASSSATDGTSQSSSQNVFGELSDTFTGFAFSLLHAFDPDPVRDSSKNLRVLWARALLDTLDMIDDDVASTFLPPTTRGIVTSKQGASLFQPIVQFTEWIQARTDFIDGGLNHFLTSPLCESEEDGGSMPCNAILIGAGYDTRALRFRNKHGGEIKFFEADLPDVCKGKQTLYDKFKREQDPSLSQSTLVPLDLNEFDDGNVDFMKRLEKAGMDTSLPTFLCFEAVLFYVNEIAINNMMDSIFKYAENPKNGELMLCMTDSLKPAVDVPFTSAARKFFDNNGMELLEHRSRWGGAVHFCLAGSRRYSYDSIDVDSKVESDTKKLQSGVLGNHVRRRVPQLVNSYTPTQSNNPDLIKNPSFDNVWYAIAYPWQIDGYKTPFDAAMAGYYSNPTSKAVDKKPYATRLWGEPLVVYRDSAGELVCMADACPHRSVPLSMGSVNANNELVCIYHGWKFGANGDCVDVPTLQTTEDGSNDNNDYDKEDRFLKRVTKSNCGNHRAVVEHEGLVYVWRGNVLEADPTLLPSRRKGDMESVPVDTVLDYSVDYSYIVENNLDSPHLFFLHDGSVPPIESIGMSHSNLWKLRLSSFTDDCGMGHLGRFGNGRPKKLIRFDPPNIVRHGGVSGFEEEFHIVPIGPQRSRVLLRQHLPRGPILSTITGIPGVIPFLTLLVNNWNYHIALEDSNVMQGQASRIEDWGSPRMSLGGLGDDLIKRFWKWRSMAHDDLEAKSIEKNKNMVSPYFVDFGHEEEKNPSAVVGIPTGTSLYGDSPSTVSHIRNTAGTRGAFIKDNADVDVTTGETVGTYGIKQNYMQDTPAAHFPPINYKNYAKALVFDEVVKKLIYDKEFKFRPGVAPSYASSPPKPESDNIHTEVDKVLREPEIAISSLQSNDFKKSLNMTESVRA